MNTSLIFVMVAIAIGGVAWVFIYPLLSGERNAERRMASVTRKEPMQQRTPRAGQKSRREQVEGSPKQLKARQKAFLRLESLAGFSYPTITVPAAVCPGWTMVRAAPERGAPGQLRGPEGAASWLL
jgi:Flp pilus assembly protein TadB